MSTNTSRSCTVASDHTRTHLLKISLTSRSLRKFSSRHLLPPRHAPTIIKNDSLKTFPSKPPRIIFPVEQYNPRSSNYTIVHRYMIKSSTFRVRENPLQTKISAAQDRTIYSPDRYGYIQARTRPIAKFKARSCTLSPLRAPSGVYTFKYEYYY